MRILFLLLTLLLIPFVTLADAQYMGNVGSEGQTGSYTLEEALEIQKRRIDAAEANLGVIKPENTLIITDIAMPETDGFEFIRRARSLPRAGQRGCRPGASASGRATEGARARPLTGS